jgi:hypothetical protein
MKRLLLVLAVLVVAASPVFADITMTVSISSSTGPIVANGQSISFEKGTKLRIDNKIDAGLVKLDQSYLLDLATKQVLVLDHGARQVTAFDPKQILANLPVTLGEALVSVKPLGQTKEIMGRACQGFTIEMTIPMTMNGETVTMKASGPVWMAKDDAVLAEYQAAQKALTDAGLSMSPLGQGFQAKGMAEVSKALAGAGITMEQEIHMTTEGTGQIAQMMAQMGGMTMKTTVTAISTDPIPDEKFVIPAGYTKK